LAHVHHWRRERDAAESIHAGAVLGGLAGVAAVSGAFRAIKGDPEKSFVVTENIIQHKHKITPYLNEKLYGVVEQTYLKGEKVFDQGTYILNKGSNILR